MSRKSNRGEDCAPAMFPFLAVLLCTIGALVLILVISVVNSHASAKRDMDIALQDQVEQAREQSDYLETVSQELAARREKVNREIDRRRKELANVEDHILRLKSQMDLLRSQAETIETGRDQDDQARQEQDRKIEAVKTEIDAKRKEIAEEIERAKDKKPAFSIIPYDGPNGTSRRPVYLECRAEGVVIQPEGIVIGIEELRPPYGPGNPVDSALRVLRAAYQKRDATFGLTIPPYPLLVVRPDGIHSYAMARAAMSSWDDQFGYELIDADMDLVFPPGIPTLKEELLSTLNTARKRQDALLASLPRQYARARDMDAIDLDSLAPDSLRETKEQLDSDPPIANDSREWKMIEEMPDTRLVTPDATNSKESSNTGSTGLATAASSGSIQALPKGSLDAISSGGQPGGPMNLDGWSASGSDQSFASDNAASANGGSPGNSGNQTGTSASPNQGNPNPGSQAPSQSRANAFTSGSSGFASQSLQGTDAPSSPESESMQSAVKEMQNKEDANQPTSFNIQKKSNKTSDDASKPIAANRGKGWATPGKDPKATPVTRPIRIVVLEDRWLVRKEGSETQFDAEIDLALGPQNASSTLEKTLRSRVDSWGISLPGGYWCPTIVIEHASDAQHSIQRLQRFLEGSGVETRLAPLQAPPVKTVSPSSNPPRR
jgi:hypothetical protein